MTKARMSDTLIAANDDLTAVDHLVAAYRMTSDPFAKHLIGLALMNEGQKISQDMSELGASLGAPAKGLVAGT